jgi:hypothetical protein
MRRAFNFYHSYYEVYCGLDDKQKNQFMEALIEVQFLGKHIDKIEFEDKMLNVVWKAIKHSVKKQIEGYCNSIQTNYEALFYDNPSAYEAVPSSASTQVQGEGEGEGEVQGEVQEGINASLRSASVKKGDMFDVEFEQFYATLWDMYRTGIKAYRSEYGSKQKAKPKVKAQLKQLYKDADWDSLEDLFNWFLDYANNKLATSKGFTKNLERWDYEAMMEDS